jgi:hypothetical protein
VRLSSDSLLPWLYSVATFGQTWHGIRHELIFETGAQPATAAHPVPPPGLDSNAGLPQP